MKNFTFAKPLMLPFLHQIIGLVLFWKTDYFFETYAVLSIGLIFLLVDAKKSLLKNMIEIASIFMLLLFIGFFLPGSEQVLVMRYAGITVLSVILIYFMKKNSTLFVIKDI